MLTPETMGLVPFKVNTVKKKKSAMLKHNVISMFLMEHE